VFVAMMVDTYIDVRSASLNCWSLKQAQYYLNRQGFAALLRWPTHFPVMDNGYAFSSEYDHFFTNFASSSEAEITVENLRKSKFEEAKRAGRMAELAVEGISGMNEVVSGQIAEMGEKLFETKRAHLALTQEVRDNQEMQA
jgi:hypothetical protein